MRNRRDRFTLLLLVTTIAAVVGCANPADDKPEAVVSEPTDKAETTASGGVAYRIDPTSTIGFIGSKVTGSHEGGFKAFEGEIRLEDGSPETSEVHVLIDTTSLWSDADRLTKHLKSPDFFDVEAHPTAEFTSTGIVAEGGEYRITGNLQLHGVEKSISFPATIEVGEGSVVANAEFSIKRFDFNIEYKGMADDLIRDEVVIKLALTASPAS